MSPHDERQLTVGARAFPFAEAVSAQGDQYRFVMVSHIGSNDPNKEGKILASHSQGFWLQGYLPMEILYFNKKMGMYPLNDIITGPIVINASNVDQWIKFVKNIIGEDAYKKQITW